MKGKLAALLAGLVLGGTGAGVAATQSGQMTPIFYKYGIVCLEDAQLRGVVCSETKTARPRYQVVLTTRIASAGRDGSLIFIKRH